MDYAAGTPGFTAYGSQAQASRGEYACAEQPPRILDGLAEAAHYLRRHNAQLQAMLDRFNPSPRDAGNCGQQIAGRAPYTVSFQEVAAELQTQSTLLDQLERFV